MEGQQTRKTAAAVDAENENGRHEQRQTRNHAPNRHQSEGSSPPNRKMKQNRRHLEPIREHKPSERDRQSQQGRQVPQKFSAPSSCAWPPYVSAHKACRTAS